MNPIILFEDKHIIVCHKEAGIPVQSARLGQKDMESILNTYLMEKGENIRVEAVHRLDQPVEGIIVFAKTKKAASELGKQLQQNTMHKVYRAVCCVQKEDWKAGIETIKINSAEESDSGYVLKDYLVKDGKTNTSSVTGAQTKGAKQAELSFRILKESDDKRYMLAEICLKTGRHHQIRVQMSHAGLPLYGDQKYHTDWKSYLKEADEARRNVALGLCAVSLEFTHPANGKKMCFHVEPKAEVFML